jgi:hypothetical protein
MKTNFHRRLSRNSKAVPSRRSERFNSHELAFQPWFLPKASRIAIGGLIPPGYRNKMRAYFDDYGCMRCGKYELYDANGMCLPCHHLIRRRLKTSVRRRKMGTVDDRIDLIIERRKELASKLLGRFAQPWSTMSLRHRINAASLKNPVDEALGFLTPGGWTNRNRVFQSDTPDNRGPLGKSVRDIRPGRPSR